jgi:hypothetical protein
VRPLANPSDGDDSDTNGWDQLGTQNRCEAQHCRAQEDVSFGGRPTTRISQIKTGNER